MRFYKYTVVYNPEKEDKESYYDVSVPAYPEIHTFGDSLEEARFMAQDALELVVSSDLDENISPRSNEKPKRLPKNATIEEIVIAISHQVSATPYNNVKSSIIETA